MSSLVATLPCSGTDSAVNLGSTLLDMVQSVLASVYGTETPIKPDTSLTLELGQDFLRATMIRTSIVTSLRAAAESGAIPQTAAFDPEKLPALLTYQYSTPAELANFLHESITGKGKSLRDLAASQAALMTELVEKYSQQIIASHRSTDRSADKEGELLKPGLLNRIFKRKRSSSSKPRTHTVLLTVIGDARTGAWNKAEWAPTVFRSAEALGVLPDNLGIVDWITVNDTMKVLVAAAVEPDVESATTASRTNVVNLVNPQRMPWSQVVEAFRTHLPAHVKVVPSTEWLAHIEEASRKLSTSKDPKADLARIPAIKLLSTYQGLVASRHQVLLEVNAAKTLTRDEIDSAVVVNEDLAGRYVRFWQKQVSPPRQQQQRTHRPARSPAVSTSIDFKLVDTLVYGFRASNSDGLTSVTSFDQEKSPFVRSTLPALRHVPTSRRGSEPLFQSLPLVV
ncbi:unnamed protein product [Tilletia controversa]|nr:unnamed protein product [Tilletia controversa]